MGESGVCVIKSEFVLPEQEKVIDLDLISDKDKHELNNEDEDSPSAKRRKLSKNDKIKLKGQNKARGPTYRVKRDVEICNNLVDLTANSNTVSCERKVCQYLHDVKEYLKIKPKDIGEECYNYNVAGKCLRGLACRFGSKHITDEGKNNIDEEKLKQWESIGLHTKNQLKQELQWSLRKRTYDFSLTEKLVKYNDEFNKKQQDSSVNTNSGCVTDEDVIKLLQREKKTIDWRDKLFLSPLTTVGNLPFRRICKELGADVTCGEMAMCSSLLQGAPQEWALVKRHHSEDLFGVQLCANNPHLLTKCGYMLEKECDIDFIDLNIGCPIELVYKQGGGCGLLRRPRVLEYCVRNLSSVLSIPMTVKTRTGVYSDEKIAHEFAPKFREWGASMLTIHGRSREQRYTKVADWEYIQQVASAAAPLPVLGNGDILSFEDFKRLRETAPDLASVMIGRGALIKPWIFTEIKEQKLWDISSAERLEFIRKYSNYGLEHWGSDNKGVENTRRFLLEWLSFLYRYVPVGVLERPPQKINERPPCFKGRDDLETLMASPKASDWIKISEMFLGPVPEGFKFLPKHKANSYK